MPRQMTDEEIERFWKVPVWEMVKPNVFKIRHLCEDRGFGVPLSSLSAQDSCSCFDFLRGSGVLGIQQSSESARGPALGHLQLGHSPELRDRAWRLLRPVESRGPASGHSQLGHLPNCMIGLGDCSGGRIWLKLPWAIVQLSKPKTVSLNNPKPYCKSWDRVKSPESPNPKP